MKPKERNIQKYLLCLLCIALFSLAGYLYISSSPLEEEKEDTWADSGSLKIGSNLTIQNTDNRLSLLDSKDVLSANGLYYAAWIMGDSESYENSEGEQVDLYDAQLYLILAEHKNGSEAQKDMTKWLDTAKRNYEVLNEEEISCNGQPCLLITYNCISDDNPYARGLSAFCVHDNDAACIELTCRDGFTEDLRDILIPFLNNCTFGDN